MKVAIEGCAHGELDKIYDTIALLEQQNGFKVDLLLICGDFQSVRNVADLDCMAVPQNYRRMQTFYKYYSGEKIAPILTIFIGGNHEASNYLSELAYGGWVCPNIYYMGYANVLNVGGLRIAGLSGIFKPGDYMKGHFEVPPYTESSKRSAYHIRNLDVFRLKQIQQPVDIIMSHDWPTGVYHFGNKRALLKKKPFFRSEMEENTLGSRPAREILDTLKPKFWFSAHLHCKFAAVVPHEDDAKSFTRFLALDKCLPSRKFLQVLDFEIDSKDLHIEYDAEWLSILKTTDHLYSTSRATVFLPGKNSKERWDFTPSLQEINDVKKLFNQDLKVPNNFTQTAPIHPSIQKPKLETYINPQTEKLCEILSIKDPLAAILNRTSSKFTISDFSSTDNSYSHPEEISNSDDSFIGTTDVESSFSSFNISRNITESLLDISGGFFIDTKGGHEDVEESDLFYIDKEGSQPDNADSESDNNMSVPSESKMNIPTENKLSIPSEDKMGITNVLNEETKNLISETSLIEVCSVQSSKSFLQCSTPVVKEESKEFFPELKEENVKRNSLEADCQPSGPTKKFRRRNYDLYKDDA